MDDRSKRLAALLRAQRESAGLTQRQLASQAGVSLGALQDLEQGRTLRPRRQSLDRLAAVLIHLGDAHQAAGDDGAARDAWEQALALLEDLGHPDAAQLRSRLGRAPAGHGSSPAATAYCAECAPIGGQSQPPGR